MKKSIILKYQQNAVKVIAFLAGALVLTFLFASIFKTTFADSNEPKPFSTVDQITGLTTYKSTDGNFQISYPTNLVIHVNYVHVQGTRDYHPVANVVELDSPALNKAPYVLVQYSQNLQTESVKDYVMNSSECDDLEDLPGENITVSGVPGLLYKNITCSSKGETRVFFIKDKMEYNVIFSGKPVDEAFLSNFLANFKFLPQ